MTHSHGFTLFESLITLTLLSIALAVAIPTLSTAIEGQGVIADARILQRVIRLARQTALTSGQRVIICPLGPQDQCTPDWSNELAVFTDPNDDKKINHHDRVIYRWTQEHTSVVNWRGFGSGYLRISEQGYAAENGTFTLCPAGGSVSLARQLVVNRVGRSYLSQDQDNDGIVEYGRNQEPAC